MSAAGSSAAAPQPRDNMQPSQALDEQLQHAAAAAVPATANDSAYAASAPQQQQQQQQQASAAAAYISMMAAQPQAQPPHAHYSTSNKLLVEKSSAQQQQQQQGQDVTAGALMHAAGGGGATYGQSTSPSLSGAAGGPALYSVAAMTPSDISPSEGAVAPFPPHMMQQQQQQQPQRYMQDSHFQQQLQQGGMQHYQHVPSQSHSAPGAAYGHSSPQAFAQVLVAGLPTTLTQVELADLFSPLPAYERCGIALDPATGVSIGRGWLVFSSSECALSAIARMNGLVVAGHTLQLSMMQPIGESTKSNIYVAGLPKQYTQAQLEQLFGTFGTIIESKVLADPSGLSRGVAFVRFDNSSSAAQAITAVNGHVMADGLHTYTIRVKFARDHHRNADPTLQMLAGPQAGGMAAAQAAGSQQVPRSAAIYQSYIPPHVKARGDDLSGGVALFVFHIPAEFTSRDLQELFAPCATVLSARIAIHPQTLESKGFGFVTCATLEEAHQAVTLLNGRRVGRKFIKVGK